ncbi:MAG: sigma-54-dependent Fis family transcriptional regulator, partial [Gemmatimonadetes bacterium]|nr:sigma-54-dependent Fis family transcriptional regulator [Gemmatimonadota bacterium]
QDLDYSPAATMGLSVEPPYMWLALQIGLVLSVSGVGVFAVRGTRRRRERDVARTELVQERRRHITTQPHDIDHWTIDDFVAASSAAKGTMEQIRNQQQQGDRVLITGETGTGKELVARAIHAGSSRRGGAFVPVRCAGLPRDVESLAERTQALSLLFGHKKGAVPGADTDQDGLVAEAHGGSLFFDEVGLLPLPLQAHLLRVLTQREVRPIGGSEGEPLDLRVLSATSEDLDLQVQMGAFHRGLFDYLAMQQIAVPALRERPEDIAPLAQEIADQAAARQGQHPKALSQEVLQLLQNYGFPGNVRQLRRLLEQALTAAASKPLAAGDLPLD